MSESRRVLITGASRGLGCCLAKHLLDRGFRVVGCARGEPAIEADNYLHVQADVTDQRSVHRLMSRIRERLGGLDVLINNAGVGRMLPVALTPPETVREIVDVNFVGTFVVTHAALRLMRNASSGRIVNFSSVAVPLRLDGEAVYAAAKSAVETFTRVLAKEVGPLGITCNAVGPTPIRTDLIRNVPEEKLKVLIDRQAIRQWAEPGDVANVVDFFLQPESRMVTGQVVYLGGLG